VRLQQILSWTFSARDVLLSSYRFQMARVATGSDAAQMVDLKTFWDRSLVMLVDDPM